jgi:hypothetical protein
MCSLADFVVCVVFVVYSTILNEDLEAETWKTLATINTNSRTKNVELDFGMVKTWWNVVVYIKCGSVVEKTKCT